MEVCCRNYAISKTDPRTRLPDRDGYSATSSNDGSGIAELVSPASSGCQAGRNHRRPKRSSPNSPNRSSGSLPKLPEGRWTAKAATRSWERTQPGGRRGQGGSAAKLLPGAGAVEEIGRAYWHAAPPARWHHRTHHRQPRGGAGPGGPARFQGEEGSALMAATTSGSAGDQPAGRAAVPGAGRQQRAGGVLTAVGATPWARTKIRGDEARSSRTRSRC